MDSQAPGRQVWRRLPLPGRLLVQPGDVVLPQQVVAEADLLPGQRWVIPAAKQLAVPDSELVAWLSVRPGQVVRAGQVLAARADSEGRPVTCQAPVSGVLAAGGPSGQLIVCESLPERVLPLILPAAELLRCRPQQLLRMLWCQVGDSVRPGDVLAGSWPGECLLAPCAGRVEAVESRTGEITLRPLLEECSLSAAVAGRVLQVEPGLAVQVEAAGDRLSVPFLWGGIRFGRLRRVATDHTGQLDIGSIGPAQAGEVLLVNGLVDGASYFRAAACRVAGVIAAGAHLLELLQLAGRHFPAGWLDLPASWPGLALLTGFGQRQFDQSTWRQLQLAVGGWASLLPSRQQPEGSICLVSTDSQSA